MRKVRSSKGKIGFILIIYSIVMTLIFVVGISVFIRGFNNEAGIDIPQAMVAIDEVTLQNDTGIYEVKKDDNIISRTDISSYYNKQLHNNIPIVIMLIVTMTASFTLLLWVILKKIDRNEMLDIAKGLGNIDTEQNIYISEPLIAEVYKEVKGKLDANIEDYKRLNSYISHEQKNAIAILKTKLEIKKEDDLIKSLDKVSHGIEDILTISDTNDIKGMNIIDIAFICAEVCDEYKKVFKDISFDFDEYGNTNIYSKERWVYRSIANLIDNAIKYGNDKPIEVRVANEKGSVIVTVKDNGIGMSEDKLNSIFDNRYRINKLNKDGYGIGLSLVNHVCSLCGGYIWVESEVNKGSIFYLVFKEV